MTAALLRVPLHLKIVAASVFCSGLAFSLGLLATGIAQRTSLREDFFTVALALGLAWVLIAAFVGAAIIRIALAPLRHLEDAAARVEGGDLQARALLSRLADRDIARLVSAFNRALDQQAVYRERHRELARRTLRSEEASSRRMAVELREGPGQRLASLLVQLRVARGNGEDGPRLSGLLEEARGEITTVLEILNRHAGDRAGRLLDDLGLSGAVEWQARRMGRDHGLEVSIRVEPVDGSLSRSARLSLFHVVQEALENVARHAMARAASVRIRQEEERVVTEIIDDGRGFDPREGRGRGLGLLGMEERIAALDGRLEVVSAPSRGTRVRAEVPARGNALTVPCGPREKGDEEL